MPRTPNGGWTYGLTARVCERLVFALIALALSFAAATDASASGFRRLALSTVAFSTDGARYAVWQVSKSSPIVILDTSTGRQGQISGCSLDESSEHGAGGRFLVRCGDGESLLDVRTDAITALPSGEYGPEWQKVGLRYVGGRAELHARCHQTMREGCTALYNIATGVVTNVPESQVPDIDRPGAPPACRTFRHRLLRLERGSLPEQFSYSEGLLARTVQIGEAPVTELRIERCHRRATILHVRTEAENIYLSGGLLTWDTGHGGTEYQEEEVGDIPPGALKRGVLSSYRLSTGQRRSWTLPRLPLHTDYPQPTVGVFGYSAHTDYAVLWIAARSLNCDKTCDVATSSVYIAPMS
jgi:hypothetical protein